MMGAAEGLLFPRHRVYEMWDGVAEIARCPTNAFFCKRSRRNYHERLSNQLFPGTEFHPRTPVGAYADGGRESNAAAIFGVVVYTRSAPGYLSRRFRQSLPRVCLDLRALPTARPGVAFSFASHVLPASEQEARRAR